MSCKYHNNFFKRLHRRPNDFEALYNAGIVPVNNEVTLSQKREPGTEKG